MSKKAFDKISEGLTEALAIARGEEKAFKLHVPAKMDVRAIRRELSMSQENFAHAFGFTVTQIRDWEQGRSRPLGANRAYLLLIENNPVSVLQQLQTAAARKVA